VGFGIICYVIARNIIITDQMNKENLWQAQTAAESAADQPVARRSLVAPSRKISGQT
jgi:hypothetical protein